MRAIASSFARRWFRELRTEGAGRHREAAALGLGVFIGCLPFYGFHLLLVAGLGWLFGLNRLRMYVAANISNPVVAPALVLAELQLGAWLRRRDVHDLTLATIRDTDPWLFGGDLLLGSVVLGVVLGAAVMAGNIASVVNTPRVPPHIDACFATAADRYLEHSIVAWEFARGKLRRDPVYRALLDGGLPAGGTLTDIGCGQGLTLAALAAVRAQVRAHGWPTRNPPLFTRLVGIETRGRVAALATRALAGDAEVVHAFAPAGLPDAIDVALLIDVLHLMEASDQQRLMGEVGARLAAGGVVMVREADAAGGWGFRAVALGNRLKNLAVGNWRQSFFFRTADDWELFFVSAGWSVRRQPMGEGTPFANVLFHLTRLDPASDAHH